MRTAPKRITSSGLVAALAAVSLGACASSRDEVRHPVDLPFRFSATGAAAVPDRWWIAFGRPELDRLVEMALTSNLDLESAWHRLREASLVARREAGALYPELDAVAGAGWRRPELAGDDRLRLGLAAAYEVDLWGRIDSSVDAERLRAAATHAEYRAAALSVAAEVTRTWLELVETHHQIDLLARQADANRRVLASLEVRFESGLVRAVDVLRQRELVEATEEERIAQEGRQAVLGHLLAVLLGQPPGAGTGAIGRTLPPLPPLPATGVPADLLRRRPDVESAYRRLQAADRDLAAAVAGRYPRLSLTASLAATGDTASGLFDDWIRSLAANLVAPLVRGGELAAEAERTRAVLDRRLSEYGQTVLLALSEVEDALALGETQLARVASLERQVALAAASSERLEAQYLNGLSEYIDVLVAQTSEQRLRRELLAARRLLLEYRVALYRALAGGFETPFEAPTRSVAARGPTPAGGAGETLP